MTEDRMFDLTIKPLEDSGIELWQQNGIDEADVIQLHPCQVRLLAERAGFLPAPDPKLLDRMSGRHVGRLRALSDRLDEIRRFYLDEIIDHCGSGIEFALHLRALEDLADEMIEDVGGDADGVLLALPAAVTSNENPLNISVTPDTSKRGRPGTGAALTNAERQAKHRAKQDELLPIASDRADAVGSNTGPRSSDHSAGIGELHRAADDALECAHV